MPAKYGAYSKPGYGPGKKSSNAGNGGGGKSAPSASYGKNANVKESKAKTFVGKGRGY